MSCPGTTSSRRISGGDGCITSRCAINRALGDVPRRTSCRPRSRTIADRSALTRTPELNGGKLAELHYLFRTTPSLTALSSARVYTYATYVEKLPSVPGSGSPLTVATRR